MSKNAKIIIKKSITSLKNILKRPLSSDLSNFEFNRELWERYAKDWNKYKVRVENPKISEQKRKSYLNYIGDEWGRVSDIEKIVEEYIYPYITNESIVAEIGTGGARIASKVVDRTKEFYCFDISSKLLKIAKSVLANYSHVKYILLNQPKFPPELAGKFDFVYSFDVFVHLDLHTIWRYLNEIRRILKKGGKAFIHTTNLKAPDGWKRFSKQIAYSPATHYFISPEIFNILAQHSTLKIIKTSSIDSSNFYLNRDYLAILEK